MENIQQKTFDLLNNNGLNWSVEKMPLIFRRESENGHTSHETPFFGMVRSDNNQTFGTCKGGYEVFQNSEMAEVAIRLEEESDYQIAKAYAYKGGAVVGVQLKGKERILEYPQKGDIISEFIHLNNSHDGSKSLSLAHGNKTISCSNLMIFRDQVVSKENIRHTSSMRAMVDQALVSMELIEESKKEIFANIIQMIEHELSASATANIISRISQEVTGVDLKEVNANWESDLYSTRSINNAKSLHESMIEELEYKGKNLWGVFSGLTHFTTHKYGADKNREYSKVMGSGNRLDNKIFSGLLATV